MMGFSIHVTLAERVSISHGLTVEDLVHEYEAKILDDELEFEDELDPRRVAGTVQFYMVKLGLAADLGMDALDACDSVSQDVCEYGVAVLNPKTGQIKENIADEFLTMGGDLLILHCAKIQPAYRGQDLGLLAAARVIDLFAQGLVICRPQPLQHVRPKDELEPAPGDSSMQYERFTKTKVQAKRSLAKHWERLGFERLGKTDFYVLSTDQQRPTVQPRAQPLIKR